MGVRALWGLLALVLGLSPVVAEAQQAPLSNRQLRQFAAYTLAQARNAEEANALVIQHAQRLYDAANARVVADSLATLPAPPDTTTPPVEPEPEPVDTTTPPPPPPPALTAPALTMTATASQVRVSWAPVPGATAYTMSARQGSVIVGDSTLTGTEVVGPHYPVALTLCVVALRDAEIGPQACVEYTPGGAPPVDPPPPDTTTPPPPPPPGPVDPDLMTFSHLPAGMSVRTDARWVGGTPAGWNLRTSYPGSAVRIVNDPTSPTGGALEMFYPSGLRDGLQPGVTWFSGSSLRNAQEIFLGVVMRYSPNWVTHNNEVKLHLFATGGSWFGIFDGCWNNRVTQWSVGTRGISGFPVGNGDCWANNVSPSPRYTNGQWVKQELYVRKNTPGQRNGIVRLWINGMLIAEHTTMQFPANFEFEEFQHAGTWGGGGTAVPGDQSVFIARTLLGAR